MSKIMNTTDEQREGLEVYNLFIRGVALADMYSGEAMAMASEAIREASISENERERKILLAIADYLSLKSKEDCNGNITD